MRRLERTRRDTRKALEIMRTQLERQSEERLQGREFDTFVRLLHFYLKALETQPDDSPAARRAQRQAARMEHIQRFEAIERLHRMSLDELQKAKYNPPNEFSDDNWRRLVRDEIKKRQQSEAQAQLEQQEPVTAEENHNGK